MTVFRQIAQSVLRTEKTKKLGAVGGPLAPFEVSEAFLDVVVESKLVRMRAQADGVHFLGALVVDIGA
jgi:hypothetical protein